MTVYQRGETVRLIITAPVVHDPVDGPVVKLQSPASPAARTIPLNLEGLKVVRVAPAQTPRPGEIWSTADGGFWLATKYHADFDDPDDAQDTNKQGWKIVMVSVDGGEYGDTPGSPEEIHQRLGLVECLHRLQVCECSDTDTFGETVHTRSCPQWPTCDCPVDDQDGTRHLADCVEAGAR